MKKIFSLGLIGVSLYANVTLCYKQNWSDITKIEQVPLDGGECSSKKSVTQMKNEGWIVKDIQMKKSKNGYDFTYILEKKLSNPTTTLSLTKENIKAELKKIQKEEAKKVRISKLNQHIKEGEKIYKSKCQECHGVKGELSPYNNSRKLNEMSLEDMEIAIRNYGLNEKDNGTAFIMQPYLIVDRDIEKIYIYLKKVNKK